MIEPSDTLIPEEMPLTAMSAWRLAGRVCAGVIVVSVQSFFRTPIGEAITAGFFVAVLVIILSLLCV